MMRDLLTAMEWGYKACERGLNIQAATAEFQLVLKGAVKVGGVMTTDAAGEFHRQKGCCDGSDPSACWKRQREAGEKKERELREANRAKRANPASEYEGTD